MQIKVYCRLTDFHKFISSMIELNNGYKSGRANQSGYWFNTYMGFVLCELGKTENGNQFCRYESAFVSQTRKPFE